MKAAKDQEQVTEEVLQRVRAKRCAESGDVSTFIRAMARLRHLWRGLLGFPRRPQRLAPEHDTQEFPENHLADAVVDLNTRPLEFMATLGDLRDREANPRSGFLLLHSEE